MNISVNIYIVELTLSVCIPNVHPAGIVSQYFNLGPSFYSMTKHNSTFHQIETRTQIEMRHTFLHLNLMYACFKFESFMWNSKRDFHVQKIFMKNLIFVFPDHYFRKFLMFLHLIHIVM